MRAGVIESARVPDKGKAVERRRRSAKARRLIAEDCFAVMRKAPGPRGAGWKARTTKRIEGVAERMPAVWTLKCLLCRLCPSYRSVSRARNGASGGPVWPQVVGVGALTRLGWREDRAVK